MKLTPEQSIKKYLLELASEATGEGFYYEDYDELSNEDVQTPCKLTKETIEDMWDLFTEKDLMYDYVSEFREGSYETDIESESYSRHYECHEVASQLGDEGVWVGWTYWYGGGKHGEPESIDWMSDAYFLDVKEEEKLVVVREFSKC